MEKNPNLSKTGAICLLVVNKIPEMPRISIESILSSTDSPVFLGYIAKEDVREFENNPRIKLLDLNEEFQELKFELSSSDYTGWAFDDFFKIVQLKWTLLTKIMGMGFCFVIYSDLDVVWQLDAYKEVGDTFSSRGDVSIQIQSFTRNLNDPRLCMGFVAFRNDAHSRKFIKDGASRHNLELLSNPRIGDDDIATILYREMGYPNWIRELPQTTFPVGVSLNLFRGRAVFPGLNAQEPFIFHANFVVGLSNKVLLMKLFLPKAKRKLLNANLRLSERIYLLSKKVKYFYVVMNRK